MPKGNLHTHPAQKLLFWNVIQLSISSQKDYQIGQDLHDNLLRWTRIYIGIGLPWYLMACLVPLNNMKIASFFAASCCFMLDLKPACTRLVTPRITLMSWLLCLMAKAGSCRTCTIRVKNWSMMSRWPPVMPQFSIFISWPNWSKGKRWKKDDKGFKCHHLSRLNEL